MNNAKKTRRLNKAIIEAKNLDLAHLNQIDAIVRELHTAAGTISAYKGVKFPLTDALAKELKQAATNYLQSLCKLQAIQNFLSLNEDV